MRRAFERYGVFFGDAEQARAIGDIEAGDAVRLSEYEGERQCYLVQISEHKFAPVIFDAGNRTIVTVLPLMRGARVKRHKKLCAGPAD